MGISEAAMARATSSSLKAQRSSSEPPPRARIRTSTILRRLKKLHRASDFGGRAIALDAHRVDGEVHIAETPAQMRTTSRTAAPLGEVIRPIRLGRSGSGFFPISGEEAFGLEALLELLESELQGTEPTGSIFST